MGMCGYLRAITPDQLQRLVDDPDGFGSFLPFAAEPGPDPGESVDLDKSWHAIHYLLTGEQYDGEPPLCNAVLGGDPVGEDLGYGPARYLTAAEVVDVADALGTVDPDDLRQRYGDGSPLADADIYPSIWDRDPDGLDYVLTHFAELVAFYRRAADNGRAVLQFIA